MKNYKGSVHYFKIKVFCEAETPLIIKGFRLFAFHIYTFRCRTTDEQLTLTFTGRTSFIFLDALNNKECKGLGLSRRQQINSLSLICGSFINSDWAKANRIIITLTWGPSGAREARCAALQRGPSLVRQSDVKSHDGGNSPNTNWSHSARMWGGDTKLNYQT